MTHERVDSRDGANVLTENPRILTQIDHARAGCITPEMRTVAQHEGRDPEFIRAGVAEGRIAIPANIHHTALVAHGVGGGLRTKVNGSRSDARLSNDLPP